MHLVSEPRVRRDRTSRLARGLLAVGAISVLVAGAVGSVSAASPEPSAAEGRHRICAEEWRAALADPSVETLRPVGDCEIERRLVTLDQLDTRVESAPQLTELHKAQLQDENDVNPASYDAVRTGLLELKAEIDSETDLRALRAGIASIATDFRVYLLVVPKTHLVGGSDGVGKATVKLGQVAERLANGIEKAEAAGHDMSEARGLLSELERKTAEAASLVSGLADRLMPISPADYNAGPGKTALESARPDLRTARDLVRSARADARQIVDILKALNPA